MQTLLGYKFKYKFLKGELNILPNLLSCNPAMYPVRGDKDPQVTIILESLILLESGSPPPQTPATAPVDPPQILAIGPAPSSEAAPPLALPSTLLHDVLVAQHSSPDSQAICAKLSPDSASNGPYTLKDRIIYQNNKVWVPKELQPRVMTVHHDPPVWSPCTKKLLELIRRTYSWVGITKAVGPWIQKCVTCARSKPDRSGKMVFFTPCISLKDRGCPSQLTLWYLFPCQEVLNTSWW
ncbi:hypothetical protein DSO57_1036981 [Entomophthora muscae]|uniref:Uncharacterized protein n=1 Tax=Entomophthora muscae TaxID=34485 RepID=A0ACC2SZE9_9FUNG|nr:hypothetical protein DSO57_1036981 [Entomophthora muscae]